MVICTTTRRRYRRNRQVDEQVGVGARDFGQQHLPAQRRGGIQREGGEILRTNAEEQLAARPAGQRRPRRGDRGRHDNVEARRRVVQPQRPVRRDEMTGRNVIVGEPMKPATNKLAG